MSKRTRHADNSKRAQPTHRRAQAEQPGGGGPSRRNAEQRSRQSDPEQDEKRT